MIYIVGIGPGGKNYITPEAFEVVGMCDVVIGTERQIDPFRVSAKKIVVTGPGGAFEAMERYGKGEGTAAVLVSGDPGLYSLLRIVSEKYNTDEYRVIPGISSVQLAYSRIGRVWQNAEIVNLHGRDIDGLSKISRGEKRDAAILTDKNNTPDVIARWLLEGGMENRRVFVCSNLSYENEEIVKTDLVELSEMKTWIGLCVVILG